MLSSWLALPSDAFSPLTASWPIGVTVAQDRYIKVSGVVKSLEEGISESRHDLPAEGLRVREVPLPDVVPPSLVRINGVPESRKPVLIALLRMGLYEFLNASWKILFSF